MQRFGVKFYFFRYMDDMVILCADKEALHFILDMMGLYLGAELKVEIKKIGRYSRLMLVALIMWDSSRTITVYAEEKGILKRFYRKFHRTIKKYEINDETDIKHLFPSEYGWIIRCSEEHSKFIFNNCLNDGIKCFNYRIAG